MNKKVLSTMIYLCWGVLIGYVCIKLFLGKEFAILISNANLIKAGNFIDNYWWIKRPIFYATTWLTYFLYFCAVSRRWILSKKHLLFVTIMLIPLQAVKAFKPTIGMQLDIVFMVTYPYFLKANYKDIAIIFTVHYLGQAALLYARSLPLLLIDTNFLTQFILSIDAYILLIIYYLYSNKYKESILNGRNNAASIRGRRHSKTN